MSTLQAFVEANPHIQWCPYPGCDQAILFHPPSAEDSPTHKDSSQVVHCGNRHYFCRLVCKVVMVMVASSSPLSRDCKEEPHEPCNCDEWKKWLDKADELAPKIGDRKGGVVHLRDGRVWSLKGRKVWSLKGRGGCGHSREGRVWSLKGREGVVTQGKRGCGHSREGRVWSLEGREGVVTQGKGGCGHRREREGVVTQGKGVWSLKGRGECGHSRKGRVWSLTGRGGVVT